MRQQYTGYERDSETGMDYAQARYYSPSQGRFTSPDPLAASMRASDPQSFNRYSYTGNDPVNRADPSGMKDMVYSPDGGGGGFLPGADGAMGRVFPGQGSDLGNDGYYVWPSEEGETDGAAQSEVAGSATDARKGVEKSEQPLTFLDKATSTIKEPAAW